MISEIPQEKLNGLCKNCKHSDGGYPCLPESWLSRCHYCIGRFKNLFEPRYPVDETPCAVDTTQAGRTVEGPTTGGGNLAG